MNKLNLPPLHKCSIAVIGLGYVGLPLAIAIANQKNCLLTSKKNKRKIIGFDLDNARIEELNKGLDRNKVYYKNSQNNFENIEFTSDPKSLRKVDVFIITVPTPIDDNKNPNLIFIKEASRIVGQAIKSPDDVEYNRIIIYESTVYPGLTEEICIPILEEESEKIYNSQKYHNTFYCGYSPERINPGDEKYSISTIIKVTSGCNEIVGSWIDSFYGSFIKAGTFKASSIKVAEAAKIIENTQRDINIALINELSMLFKKMNIDTQEVLEAAGTKWNFQKYFPGLVGGHCIGVDPYYLTFKAKEIGFDTTLISAGRSINDYMDKYLFQQIINFIDNQNEDYKNIKILLLGLSYKSNCPDMRNSKLLCLIKNISKHNLRLTIVDPIVDKKKALLETGLKPLIKIPEDDKYLIIIFGLYHEEFEYLSIKELKKSSYSNTVIFDLTNKLCGKNVVHL